MISLKPENNLLLHTYVLNIRLNHVKGFLADPPEAQANQLLANQLLANQFAKKGRGP